MQKEESLVHKAKKNLPLHFGKAKGFYYFLFLVSLLLPFGMFLLIEKRASENHQWLFLISLFSTFFLNFFTLRSWETRMRRSVTYLVRKKLKLAETSLNSSQTGEVDQIEGKVAEIQMNFERQLKEMQVHLDNSLEEIKRLRGTHNQNLEQMRCAYLEFEDLRKEYHRLEDELMRQKEEYKIDVSHRENLMGEYQRTIAEQRMIIEKKQRYIAKLEAKIRDLMYEIRSLLQLEDSSRKPSPEISPSENDEAGFFAQNKNFISTFDASQILKKYLKKAESLTGMDHLGYVGGGSPRFLDLAADSYEVDKRRLGENFNDDTLAIVFIYSLSERKFLFVNRAIKSTLGWGTEKFMKDFPYLVVHGISDWKATLAKVHVMKECQSYITVKDKSGKNISFESLVSLISRGPFSGHVLGIFLPAINVPSPV